MNERTIYQLKKIPRKIRAVIIFGTILLAIMAGCAKLTRVVIGTPDREDVPTDNYSTLSTHNYHTFEIVNGIVIETIHTPYGKYRIVK